MNSNRTRCRWLSRRAVLAAFLAAASPIHFQQYQAIILPRPPPFPYAYGGGATTGREAGWGIPEGGDYQADIRALLWIDTQPPLDITPPGFRAARIDDAEGDQSVGSVSKNPPGGRRDLSGLLGRLYLKSAGVIVAEGCESLVRFEAADGDSFREQPTFQGRPFPPGYT